MNTLDKVTGAFNIPAEDRMFIVLADIAVSLAEIVDLLKDESPMKKVNAPVMPTIRE
jgi:hypothetical protein